MVYAPWVSAPFPIIDYSEFLNPLRAAGSFFDGLRNVSDFYRSAGRSSYLAYVQLVVNWTLFGERPVAWGLSVFTFVALAVFAVWTLLVRLGNTAPAAFFAAAMLIVATPSVHAWLRPTGEPLALLFLALALVVALSYQEARRWYAVAVIILLLCLGIGLSKDLLAPLLLFPVVVACCWNDGLRFPRLSTRNVVLMTGAAVIGVVLMLLIAEVVSQSAPDAYARAYRAENVSIAGVARKLSANLLPHTRGYSPLPIGLDRVLANAMFVGLIVVAWRAAPQGPSKRRTYHELLGGLALAAFGALLYAPLGWYTPFYALPFFLGSVILFARAVSVLERSRPALRWLARAAAGFIILTGAISAFNVARKETAFRRVHGQLAEAMVSIEGIDTVIVTTTASDPRNQADQAGFIRHHALVRGRAAPAARAVPCADYRVTPGRNWPRIGPGATTLSRRLLVNYPDACGDLEYASAEFAQPYLMLTPWPVRRYLRIEFVILERGSPVPYRQR